MKQKDNFEHSATSVCPPISYKCVSAYRLQVCVRLSATSVCPPIRRHDVGVIADKVDEAVT